MTSYLLTDRNISYFERVELGYDVQSVGYEKQSQFVTYNNFNSGSYSHCSQGVAWQKQTKQVINLRIQPISALQFEIQVYLL